MANQDLTAILDECVARIQAGEPVSACVRDYPEYRDQLEPLLTAAANLTTLPRPAVAEQGRQRGRERMLAQLSQNQPQPVSFLAFLRYARQKITGSLAKERPNMKLVLRSALTALCLLILSTAIVTASQNSLPGDPLYPVKRSWEWVQGSFVPAPEQDRYKDELLTRRYQELQLLMEAGRQVSFDLDGVLTAQTATTLQVAGFTIQTNAATQWLTLPAVGDSVQINLLVQSDGTLLARQVAVSERPVPAMTATPTATVTRTPNSCTGGVCPTATPTACPNPNCVTPTPTRCNTPNCATPTPTPCTTSPNCVTVTPTPCTTSPNCVTPTVTRTPNCNPANCPTPTATPWCGATICPTFTPTATPGCNTGICPTETPIPTITRTPNCTPSTCATATPVPTATPTACNTPNCQPPTATPIPGCNPANCPTATPTPGCSAGTCPTPTPTACPNTPNCTTVTPTSPPATATPTPGCNPNNCPTNTPTPTRGCNTGTCATPPPTPTQCNTPNCVTPTFTPPPGCSPTNCPTPTPTPWCGATICPTFTPTTQMQGKGLGSIHFRFR